MSRAAVGRIRGLEVILRLRRMGATCAYSAVGLWLAFPLVLAAQTTEVTRTPGRSEGRVTLGIGYGAVETDPFLTRATVGVPVAVLRLSKEIANGVLLNAEYSAARTQRGGSMPAEMWDGLLAVGAQFYPVRTSGFYMKVLVGSAQHAGYSTRYNYLFNDDGYGAGGNPLFRESVSVRSFGGSVGLGLDLRTGHSVVVTPYLDFSMAGKPLERTLIHAGVAWSWRL